MIDPTELYYVYSHWYDNGYPICFYVGLGRTSRAWSTGSRSIRWKNITSKHRWHIEIHRIGLSKSEASILEVKLIKAIGRKDLNLGPLINMSDGGDGIVGLSEESRQKMSKSATGRKLPPRSIEHLAKIGQANRGRKLPLETRRKMSAARLGKKRKPFTEEHKMNLRRSKANKVSK